MTAARPAWAMALVAALVALVASIAWTATMDDRPWAMMSYGSGMTGFADPGGGEPVTDLGDARRQAERFADRLDLRVGEVMRFSDGYYAQLEEDEGTPATEVLVDPDRGAVWLEHGPAMMWNTRYGMMRSGSGAGMGERMMGWRMGSGGAMGTGAPADATWAPGRGAGAGAAIGEDQARRIAQRWLDANRSGLRATEATAFPGYVTLHAERDGRIVGMLSVNGETGAVWYHWWHGRFVEMAG